VKKGVLLQEGSRFDIARQKVEGGLRKVEKERGESLKSWARKKRRGNVRCCAWTREEGARPMGPYVSWVDSGKKSKRGGKAGEWGSPVAPASQPRRIY